ncbi:hypothetical protein HGRIS_008757 [Hohenbuehelia grisea]|uniref:Fungal-type protein kinase domain-containing protein n=1 Tax=Hohenbuehelia grisea TaxID=104357 RepID=A0ABR3J911_9AGAR
MVETIHDSEVLKSQLIGASKEQCSWFVAEILGEVGSKRKRLIVLVGSYAKSVFATADIQREPQGTMSTGLPTSLQRHRRPLQRLLRLQSARPTGTIELPDLLVTECSLLVAGKDLEEDIFRLVTPYVGIADNITMHDIPCVQTLDEVAHWRILDVTKKVRHVSQLRLDRHLPVRTVGRSLRTAHGPRELGFAILHAMIGHCALFTVAGYVHREVTIGNILLLDEADELEIPPCLVNIIESTDCIAVLLDGGFVKKWGDTRDVTRHRSGTKTFVSSRIITNWELQKPLFHTPIDDLESFIWVLYYTLLDLDAELPRDAALTWDRLRSDQLHVLSAAKANLRLKWTTDRHIWVVSDLPRCLQPFYELFRAWFATASFYYQELIILLRDDPTPLAIRALSVEAYQRFIREGVQHIPSLPSAFEQLESKPTRHSHEITHF